MNPYGLIGVAYLLGSIPFGLLVVKAQGGPDIRSTGSGNIGAANVARSAGALAGVLTLLLDAGKGYLAVWLEGRQILLIHGENHGDGLKLRDNDKRVGVGRVEGGDLLAGRGCRGGGMAAGGGVLAILVAGLDRCRGGNAGPGVPLLRAAPCARYLREPMHDIHRAAGDREASRQHGTPDRR